ncbi:MAG: cupin domain-containing protein [Thermodesulfobacteriota bacterium]
MELKQYADVNGVTFDDGAARGVRGRVLIGIGDGAPNFCMRLFEIEPGGYTPRHSHEWEHEMFFHSGEGEVFGGGSWQPVKPGSVVFVKSGEEHQTRNTGNIPLVVVCLVPSHAPEL